MFLQPTSTAVVLAYSALSWAATNAAVTTTIRLRFERCSTPIRLQFNHTHTHTHTHDHSTLRPGVVYHCTSPTGAGDNVFGYRVRLTGGFNGRPLVQWPTRPLGGWALEAPGPRDPESLNFGLQLQSPDCNLNWIYDLFKLETSTLIRRSLNLN